MDTTPLLKESQFENIKHKCCTQYFTGAHFINNVLVLRPSLGNIHQNHHIYWQPGLEKCHQRMTATPAVWIQMKANELIKTHKHNLELLPQEEQTQKTQRIISKILVSD